jgi:hypothetical protein
VTVSTAQLAALADHYAAVTADTATPCEVLRTTRGQFVAVVDIGRCIPLGDTRDTAYATLTALVETLELAAGAS